MKLKKSLRFAVMMGVASIALVACSDTTIATPGTAVIPPAPPPAPPPPPPPPAATGFAARSTEPQSQADCPTGTVFAANVALPVSGQMTNFCSLTDDSTASAATGGAGGGTVSRAGTVTGIMNIPLSADPILIQGSVFIGDPAGDSADVTFAAGQTFISASQEGVVDLLVVSRGSTLTAVGTPTQPIIFTSAEDFEDDLQPNGTSGTGDWGGLAINGAAPLNECTVDTAATPGSAQCEQNGEGGSGVFGGALADDSSGSFQYVRVQHAGFQFTSTNELNGIALQGVGSGTLFDSIQVHRGADDGFEWFGGTVDATNLVVTGAGDDSFDWTDGWSGSLQFGLVVQEDGDDNGIEGDNNGDTSPDAMPRSMPRLSNITLIGDGAAGEGMQLRAGTAGNYANMIITNFAEGFEFGAAGTGPNPTVNSLFVTGNVENLVGGAQALFDAGMNNVLGAGTSLDGVLPGAAELALVATDPQTIDPDFESALYVGAFGPDDTAARNWTTGWTIDIPGAEPPTCPTGTTVDESDAPSNFPNRAELLTCVLSGTITQDISLVSGNLYRLDGTVFIGEDGGPTPGGGAQTASVTIDPGVTIFGDQEANIVDLLVIARGSQIFANGSSISPVILTSRADLENNGVIRGTTGEIGGIAINGRAPLNECTINTAATPGTAACAQNGEGGSGLFGGAISNDNSGRINFMQIRYAGFQFTSTNELNALALQGVGSGTELDFIQVLNGADDGVEWFGGTVNASHIVVTGSGDDSIDWTDGWSGTLQYAIVRQSPGLGDDNGIEGDNNGDTDPDAAPRSTPIIANLTMIGDGSSGEGIQVRAGTAGAVVNSIVTNFAEALEFNPAGMGPDPIIDAVAFSGVQSPTPTLGVFAGSGAALFATGNNTNTAANTLTAPVGFTTPLVPGANETAPAITAVNPVTICETVFTGAATNPCASLDATDYVGALEDASDRWFAGWTIGL